MGSETVGSEDSASLPRCAVFSAQLEVGWSWRCRGEFAQFESRLRVGRWKLAVGRDPGGGRGDWSQPPSSRGAGGWLLFVSFFSLLTQL